MIVNKNLKAKNQIDALFKIANIAKENNIVKCSRTYLKGLLERENKFTTGIGNGIAMPHCRCETVNEIEIIICILDKAVDWNSIDNNPVDFIIALAIPKENLNHEYLNLISKLSRVLIDKAYVYELKSFKDEIDIIRKIQHTIN
jgi:fructose-specific phosphotransferase system IIA component